MFKIRLIFDMSNIPVNQINTSKMQDFDKKRTRWEQSLVGATASIPWETAETGKKAAL